MLSGLIFLNFGFLGFMYWMMLIIAFMDWETMLVFRLASYNLGDFSSTEWWNKYIGRIGWVGNNRDNMGSYRGKAMGAGDIEIAAVLGLWLGFPKIITGLWFAFVIGGIYGAFYYS